MTKLSFWMITHDMNSWHELMTWTHDMNSWHELMTWTHDMNSWHELMTWTHDMNSWHELMTWTHDMNSWHELMTWTHDMNSWHELMTWTHDMNSWHELMTWTHDMLRLNWNHHHHDKLSCRIHKQLMSTIFTMIDSHNGLNGNWIDRLVSRVSDYDMCDCIIVIISVLLSRHECL